MATKSPYLLSPPPCALTLCTILRHPFNRKGEGIAARKQHWSDFCKDAASRWDVELLPADWRWRMSGRGGEDNCFSISFTAIFFIYYTVANSLFRLDLWNATTKNICRSKLKICKCHTNLAHSLENSFICDYVKQQRICATLLLYFIFLFSVVHVDKFKSASFPRKGRPCSGTIIVRTL